jgi:photosystem II stability/assembly factor-like uncharacterized protein
MKEMAVKTLVALAATMAAAGCGATPSAPRSAALAAIQFVGPLDGWAAGAGRILTTADGGRRWIRRYAGPADLDQVDFIDRDPQAVCFANASDGYLGTPVTSGAAPTGAGAGRSR